ncbi:MAG: hypothetical protein NC218_05600 [Acetobacter sp.]|nr:hypothetical protein [Acetobacter sp.]
MKKTISWAIFAIVPLMFIASIILPEIISIVLVLVGCVAAGLVIILDICMGKFIAKEQVFKMFCNALLGIRYGTLFECSIVLNIAAVLAVICIFAIIIGMSVAFDNVAEEARKI